jgi:hypothetical protein
VTTPSCGPVTAFLRRAGFLVLALALMAGIFGMHIMTAANSMAGAHSMPVAAPDTETGQVHGAAGHSGHAMGFALDATTITEVAPSAGHVMASSSSCSAAGACPEMHAMDAACFLKPGNTTLSAPQPGRAPYALPDFGSAAIASVNYFYSPDSPSPGDLSISRT